MENEIHSIKSGHANSEVAECGTAIVANTGAIAVANAGLKGESQYSILPLPYLPGFALLPKKIPGLNFDHSSLQSGLRVPAQPGNLNAHLDRMGKWILEHSTAISDDKQRTEFGEKSRKLFAFLRGELDDHIADPKNEWDASEVIQYITDLPPPPDKMAAWSSEARLSIDDIVGWYGEEKFRADFYEAFHDCPVSTEDETLLRDYVIRFIRDWETGDPPHVVLCGTPLPNRVPVFQLISVGTFIADRHVISVGSPPPIKLDGLSGCMATEKWPNPAILSDEQKPVPMFESLGEQLIRAGLKGISQARLTKLMAKLFDGGRVFWSENDERFERSPPGFGSLQSADLIQIAEALAIAMNGTRSQPNSWGIVDRYAIPH